MLLLVGLACARIPTAPSRQVDLDFIYQERDGSPISEAIILLNRIGPTRQSGVFGAETDAAGHAHFHVPEGRYTGTALLPENSPYTHRPDIPEFVVSGDAGRHVFRLSGAYVSGEIRDPDGAILNAGYIYMDGLHTNGDYDYIDFAYTGSTFRLLVPPGVYQIRASGGAYPHPYPTRKIEDVAITNDTTMVFQMEGSRIQGHVTGRAGVPILGAFVYANSTGSSVTAITDAEGYYAMYLSAASYRWTITPQGSSSYILPRYAPNSPVSGPTTKDFELDGTLWSGAVLTSGTGEPQAGRYVVAVPWLDPRRSAFCPTDNAGAFHLLLERGLEYDLYVRSRPGSGTVAVTRAGIADADSILTLLVPAGAPSVTLALPHHP